MLNIRFIVIAEKKHPFGTYALDIWEPCHGVPKENKEVAMDKKLLEMGVYEAYGLVLGACGIAWCGCSCIKCVEEDDHKEEQ